MFVCCLDCIVVTGRYCAFRFVFFLSSMFSIASEVPVLINIRWFGNHFFGLVEIIIKIIFQFIECSSFFLKEWRGPFIPVLLLFWLRVVKHECRYALPGQSGVIVVFMPTPGLKRAWITR